MGELRELLYPDLLNAYTPVLPIMGLLKLLLKAILIPIVVLVVITVVIVLAGEDTPWMGELRELLYPDLLNALALCD
jgi:hypothetical protein